MPVFWFHRCVVVVLAAVLLAETVCDVGISNVGLDADCRVWHASDTDLTVTLIALATRLTTHFEDKFWGLVSSVILTVLLAVTFIANRDSAGLVVIVVVAAVISATHLFGLVRFWAHVNENVTGNTQTRGVPAKDIRDLFIPVSFLVTMSLLGIALFIHEVLVVRGNANVLHSLYSELRNVMLTFAIASSYGYA